MYVDMDQNTVNNSYVGPLSFELVYKRYEL